MIKVIDKHFRLLLKMILCISLFLICNQNVKADGYNYANFKWEDFKEMYNNFNNIEFCSEIFGVDEDIIKLRIAELGINKRNVIKYKFK